MAIADGAKEAKELSRPPAQRRSLPPALQRPLPRDRRATTATATRGPRARSGSAGRGNIIATDADMDYAWTEPKHDPIATDTNLAEIDFEDFRNEDLAYAFSCVSTENRFQFAGLRPLTYGISRVPPLQ